MKILIVEDEPSLREVMQRFLEKERYVVETAPDYRTALFKAGDYDFDCILLDITLPDGNGLELLRRFKEMRKSGSVIILSARDSLEDKVAGLEEGADDYLPKPFYLAELSARIRSVVRRSRHQGDLTVRLGNVEVFPVRFEVKVDGVSVDLLRKEYDILYYFMTRPDRLVDKQVLAESVWGDHMGLADNFDFLYAQVKNLRRKLREAGATVGIRAVYGLGYKMTEEEP